VEENVQDWAVLWLSLMYWCSNTLGRCWCQSAARNGDYCMHPSWWIVNCTQSQLATNVACSWQHHASCTLCPSKCVLAGLARLCFVVLKATHLPSSLNAFLAWVGWFVISSCSNVSFWLAGNCRLQWLFLSSASVASILAAEGYGVEAWLGYQSLAAVKYRCVSDLSCWECDALYMVPSWSY